MKVTVDEKSTLAPGLSFNSPMENVVSSFRTGGNVTTAQSFSLGLGASIMGDATRTETIAFYLPFSDLSLGTARIAPEECKRTGKATVESDLGLQAFFESKVFVAQGPKLLTYKPEVKQDGTVSPFTTLTYEGSFVVTTTGSITPTWKLVRVSANPTGTMFSASRARTDDLTITMGETTTNPQTKTKEPSSIARDQNLATLIGQAVATAIRSQQ